MLCSSLLVFAAVHGSWLDLNLVDATAGGRHLLRPLALVLGAVAAVEADAAEDADHADADEDRERELLLPLADELLFNFDVDDPDLGLAPAVVGDGCGREGAQPHRHLEGWIRISCCRGSASEGHPDLVPGSFVLESIASEEGDTDTIAGGGVSGAVTERDRNVGE